MVRMFLATANVGSVFENIEHGLGKWMDEFLKAVLASTSKFVAIHFQETGGKNYQNCTNEIDIFFTELKRRFSEQEFFQVEGFVDSQSDLEDQYTALANTYFVHKDLDESDVEIWNFKDKEFTPVSKDGAASLHVGAELQNTTKKQKEKFPQDFFPDFKWSRKGFLRTRWRIKNVLVDLVNIHMFHDSCNLIAGSAFPSPFAQNRIKTLNYTLDKLLKNDELEACPLFVFGDFNFRLNTYEVFEILRREYNSPELPSPSEDVPEQKFNDRDLLIDSKVFLCPDHEKRFKYDFNWVRPYEFEAKQFTRLLELNLHFHPTYPFDEELPDQFMRTRCPAWCDRVLFTESGKAIIAEKSQPVYDLIGSEVCMGDHKPVFLSFDLQWDSDVAETDNSFDSSTVIGTNEVSPTQGNSIGNTGSSLLREACICESSVASSTKSSTKKCALLVSCFRKRFTTKKRKGKSKRRKTQENILLESECDAQVKAYSADVEFGAQPKKSSSKTSKYSPTSTGPDDDGENVLTQNRSNPKRSSKSVFNKCFSWKGSNRIRRRKSVKEVTQDDKDIGEDCSSHLMCSEDEKNNDAMMDSQTKTKLLNGQDILTPQLTGISDRKLLVDNLEESRLNINLLVSKSNNSIVEVQDDFYERSKSEQIANTKNPVGHSSAKCFIS